MQHPQKRKEKKTLPVKWLALGLLLAALALTAALVIPKFLPQPQGNLYPEPEVELKFETLQVNDAAKLSSITVAPRDGEPYTLRCQNDTLLLELDGQLHDINDSLCADLMKAATTIAVENVVTRDVSEVAEHLPDMGLEPPLITVTVAYTDGKEEILSIGGSVPYTTYSYYRWSGDGGVYMCDAGIAEIFGHTANQLLPVTQPQLIGSLVYRLTIANPAGELVIGLAMDASGTTTGQLQSPISYPIAMDAASALMTSMENFRLGTRMGDAENLSEDYGFDEPLCTVDIHQKEGMFTRINDEGQLVVETLPAQQLRFVFGRPEGEYFYTCAYEGSAYLVSRFLVQPMIAAAPEKLFTRHPADLGSLPARIQVETERGSLTMEISQTLRLLENGQPETNEDGEWIYDTTATLNGETITGEQAELLVSRLRALSFSGNVSDGWAPGDAQPRWIMRLTAADGTERTLTAYRMDAFSDAVAVDGVILHYCYTEALEMALGEWMP